MNVQIEESWKKVLQPEFEKDYFVRLTDFVRNEYSITTILQVVTPISFLKLYLFLIAVSLCTCRHSNEEYCFYSTFDRITSGEVPIRVMAEIL